MQLMEVLPMFQYSTCVERLQEGSGARPISLDDSTSARRCYTVTSLRWMVWSTAVICAGCSGSTSPRGFFTTSLLSVCLAHQPSPDLSLTHSPCLLTVDSLGQTRLCLNVPLLLLCVGVFNSPWGVFSAFLSIPHSSGTKLP